MILVLVAKKCMPILWIVKTLHTMRANLIPSRLAFHAKYYESDLGLHRALYRVFESVKDNAARE